MANIKLLDGTRNPEYGKILREVLGELAKFQKVRISPSPGGIDIGSYNLVQHLEHKAFNPDRSQVDLDRLFYFLTKNMPYDNSSEKLIVLDKDIYTRNLNWCFGHFRQSEGIKYVLLSTARVKTKKQWFDLLAHELGHMYGAAYSGRSNTAHQLGSHCINDLCVMQQKMSVPEAIAYVKKRDMERASTYCQQCQNDLRQ